VALTAFTMALYAPALRCQFLSFDDPVYVTENRHVQAGLTAGSIAWAFHADVVGNWHPLTMLSHMLDCQIYGLRPWGHHLTSVLLHAANCVLLFLVLTRMTGAVWRSACVAALFAAHPAHVESVAWVAERKDVLSAFFYLLSIWAYVRYAEDLKFQISNFKFYRRLGIVVFALALMAKPMAVTLPFVLLLLDFWPLDRARGLDWRSWRPLVVEKWPWLALSMVWCGVTILAQGIGQAVASAADLSISERIIHTMIAYLDYVRVLVFPWHLAAYYPYHHHEPVLWGVAAGAILAMITWLAVAGSRKRPWLAVGWLWFLGMLVPVIGLVQVGGQAWADRYVYLPSIGFFVLVVWGGAEWAVRHPAVKLLVPVLGAALAASTWVELQYWKDTDTLYTRAMQVTTNNYLAMTLVGAVDEDKGQLDDAIRLYRAAVACKTNYPEAHFYLGRTLEEKGRPAEAMSEYREALRLRPDFDAAHVMVGLLLAEDKKYDQAVAEYQAALKANPESAAAQSDWGQILLKEGRWQESVAHYEQALRLNSSLAEAHQNLAVAYYQYGLDLERLGKINEAVSEYAAALRQNPDLPEALQHRAWIAATDGRPELRNGPLAVELASRACVLTGQKRASMLLTLGAAYAEAGRFADALATVARAEQLARSQGQKDLVAEAGRLRAAFAEGHSFHQQ
jgi:tetratricopeptide (TPR) repeat protein